MTSTRQLSDKVRAELLDHIPPGWASKAACATSGLDPGAWFAEPGEPAWSAARAVCWSCPVRQTCVASALTRAEFGLWGGYSEAQRATARSALAKGVPVSVVLHLGETTGRAA